MRRTNGQFGPAIIILILLAIPLLGSLAVDMNHRHEARRALQSAADAAALAGAVDLWTNIDNASSDAYRFAALNRVDGSSLTNGIPGVTVSVTVTPPKDNAPGTVEVVATREIRHLLSPMFGRATDVVRARAVAGTGGTMWRLAADQCFPLAVSIDTTPEGGQALNTKKPGDTFSINIESQGVKNGAYTSLTNKYSGRYVKDALENVLGINSQPEGFIPSVKTGDPINLSNGNLGMNLLTKEPGYSNLLNAPFIILPLIKGEPAYNQSREVVGFIGLQVTAITKNADDPKSVNTITGRLIKPQVIGESGPLPLTGAPVDDQAISRLSLGPIQLLQ